MTRPVIEVFETPGDAAREAADAILAALADAVRDGGRAGLMVTGGRSPGPVYDALSAVEFPWERVDVTLSDERCVEVHSPDSNERLVRERLLALHAATATFVPLEDAERLLPFDAALLGMGEDGHVASLFPGSPALEETALTVAVPPGDPAPPQARVSLTFRALASARLILILVSGQAKRRVLEDGEGLPVHTLLDRATSPVRVLWSP